MIFISNRSTMSSCHLESNPNDLHELKEEENKTWNNEETDQKMCKFWLDGNDKDNNNDNYYFLIKLETLDSSIVFISR